MQVLGDLIRLPNDGSLPLPWWQRASLGFLHGTNLHVGIAESTRLVGDIVVSTLDIGKWDNILRVDCTHRDEKGVLAKLMEAVLPLNIALAETVTTENGKEHHATLFCEGQGAQRVKDAILAIKENLQKGNFREYDLDPRLSPSPLVLREKWTAVINHGWLRGVPWIAWIQENYENSKLGLVDLTQAVVSADTENRLLRFVFTLKGAKTVKITHADQPGALREIFLQFAACDLNILSALLRRGGQRPGHAELIAVCESQATQNPLEVYPELRRRIQEIDPQFSAVLRIEDADRPAENVIYLPRPRNIVPKDGARPIFLDARHGANSDWEGRLNDRVRVTLDQCGYSPDRSRETHVASETGLPTVDRTGRTCSWIDSADGCVFLVTGFDELGLRDSRDLLYELGYVRALSKPALLLTESNATPLVSDWSRGGQITFMQFAAGEDAFAQGHPASLETLLRSWLPQMDRRS
jgi:hypothetical protein